MKTTYNLSLTNFTVFPSKPIRTHASVAPGLLFTGASVAAGTRSTGIVSNWKRDKEKGILEVNGNVCFLLMFIFFFFLLFYLSRSASPSIRACTHRCSLHPVRNSRLHSDREKSRRLIGAVLKNTH